ncbi:peroxidase-related enzyme [Streptomyces spiramenti]|uniref:Peroxidase-related enzyme n=1 Tax=Streptomyces spiramenti TaxID=2720606 RepID=A0ABX1AKI1_9ACTN|nr:peroxidase-related enzyme [Streptomyces spiramenti]NJP66760.1 peroxidase-related enzyme [Streptomyces spiramenti]
MGDRTTLHRAGVLAHTDAARAALLRPRAPGRLGEALRAEAAGLAAESAGRPELTARYGRGPTAGSPAAAANDDTAAARPAVRAFTRTATLSPAAVGRDGVASLLASGLDDAAVVSLAQLVAFVSYEVRVAVGEELLAGRTAGPPAAAGTGGPPPRGLTSAPLVWHPWIDPVDPEFLSGGQREVLDRHATLSTDSPYYRTLLHDPAALDHRTHVYNALMYGRGGLARADRELVTLVASRVNGCAYCAGVHAGKFARLTRDERLTEEVLAHGSPALGHDPRRKAVARFAERLAAPAPRADAGDLAAVRSAGLTDEELRDLVHCAALFGWANRLMQTLGAPAPPGAPCPGVCCTGTSVATAPHDGMR